MSYKRATEAEMEIMAQKMVEPVVNQLRKEIRALKGQVMDATDQVKQLHRLLGAQGDKRKASEHRINEIAKRLMTRE